MKLRARYTPRLGTWACWSPGGWAARAVGFGYTLDEAILDLWNRANVGEGR